MKTNMTKVGFISFFQMLSFAAMLQATSLPSNGPELTRAAELTFAENKCQIRDYSGRINRKVLFLAQVDNTKYLFRKDGMALQLTKNESTKENGTTDSMFSSGTTHKLEFFWDGMNEATDVYGAEEVNSKLMKLLNAKDCDIKNYRKLYYTEIYPGVDLRYYDNDNRLKFDLMVHPGFDYRDIKLRVEGAGELRLNNKGQLLIQTPAGLVIEDAPMVLQAGKPLVAKWILNENKLSLDIKDHNPSQELFIQSNLSPESTMRFGM